MIGYVKTFKDKNGDKSNTLMPIDWDNKCCVDEKNLLENCKLI